MVNSNKVKNWKSNQFRKPQQDKHTAVGRNRGGGAPYKKPAHGKTGFVKSKDSQKNERARKFQERQAVKAQKQKELEDERAKAKQEKEEKIRQYKKKRLEKTKVISKRTQRGQPLMKDRMQFLLKQIQEMKKNG